MTTDSRLQELKTMPYSEYLKTEEWLAFSNEMKQRVGRCQLCGTKDRSFHVHHNNYENRGQETALDVVVLCDRCHYLYELLISRTITAPQISHLRMIPYEAQELSTLHLHADQTFDNFSLRRHELRKKERDGIVLIENLKRAYLFCQGYAKNPQDWIALTGTYGCGKTHLAAAVANQLTKDGNTVLFVTGCDLINYLWAAFSPGNPYPYNKAFCELREAPILILDNYREGGPSWVGQWKEELFSYRYEARLPTLFTFFKDVDIQPFVKSLILDVGRCTPFQIMSPTYRWG